jgi:hypothetical protein
VVFSAFSGLTPLANPDFANNPISFEILLGVSISSDEPIPILWAHGLREDGTWPNYEEKRVEIPTVLNDITISKNH